MKLRLSSPMILLLFLSFLPQGQSDTLILGALPMEIELLQSQMSQVEKRELAGRLFYRGILEGHPIVLVQSGVGKVNAALTTQVALDHFPIERVIFTGVAGGIDPKLKIGDIVIATWLTYHDYGNITPKGFEWSLVPGENNRKFRYFPTDEHLRELALKVGQKIRWLPLPEELRRGEGDRKPSLITRPVVTGDQFIASEEKRSWIFKTFRAGAVEMEGAAVAQVCQANRVPCLILRSLSDLANEKAHLDSETFARYASQNLSLFVRSILKELSKEREARSQ